MTYTYNYGYNTPAAAGLASTGIGLGIGVIIAYVVFTLAICAFSIIVLWKIFTKAGKEGWKSLIPIYNIYTLCEIVGVSPWWLLIVFVGEIVCIIPILGYLAYMAATIYFGILLAKSTANAFGKDTGFAVGLYFLPLIFGAILAFNKDTYQGANPMNDIIFKKK